MSDINKVLLGDCLTIFDTLDKETIDLIYLDPPFFTQKEQKMTTRKGDKYYNFSDKWKNMDEYTNHLKIRLEKCKDLLRPTGSLFLHCDKTASHYLKVTLDSVFGNNNFQSEIIWAYRRWSNAKKGLLNNHQTIFFYSKSKNFKFNDTYDEYSPATNIDQIVQIRERDSRNKAVYKKNDDGTPLLCEEKKGVPMGDVWDIPYLNPKARERVGYPTQKPILLLERIISCVTDEGDTVLDPYCGSGTTLVASKILNRDYIGIDINKDAVNLAIARLKNPIKSESNVMKKGRQSYRRSDTRIIKIVSDLRATLVQRNKGIDALVSNLGQVVPIKIVLNKEDVDCAAFQLKKASQKNGYLYRALFMDFDCCEDVKLKLVNKYGVMIFKNIDELAGMISEIKKSKKDSLHNVQVELLRYP